MALYGSVYPSFTNNEILHIEKVSGIEACNRIHEYDKKIKSLKNDTEFIQLTKVNIYLNHRLKYQSDKILNNKSDYWATPKEFLTMGSGDCEDYAIIKYFTLLKLGFEKDKLFITLAYDKYSKRDHMVLSYFADANKPPLILDSLSYEVLDLNKRADLRVSAFINTNGVYRLSKTKKLRKTKQISNKFKELLIRVQKES
ncbi:transglutaminase-like cysteine peptidase [Sulfurimonas sp.]|uniref:transglutaminase-like cysteine peptidase n=1 Tax=Sulfurimonas sp. TaxID=2022749 RepID=UPI0035665497